MIRLHSGEPPDTRYRAGRQPAAGANVGPARGPALRDLRITVEQNFRSLEAPWRELEAEGDAHVFQSYDWLEAWHGCIGRNVPVTPCLVLVESRPGIPLMLLPLGITRAGFARALVWLGGEFSDYQGPLLARDYPALVDADRFERLWVDVLAALPAVDLVKFERLPATIGKQANPFLHLAAQPHPSDAHYMNLGGTVDALLKSKRKARTISNDRRKERRLAEHGEIRFVVANDARETARLLPVLLEQKSSGYRSLGVDDLFDSDDSRRFVQRLSRGDSGTRVLLCALTVGDDIVASFWGPVFGTRLYYLFPAYSQDEFARYSPGNILLRFIMGWCLENGVDVLDFTVGDEPYKLAWRDGHIKLHDHFQHRTAAGRIYVLAVSAQRRLKRRIKRSPKIFDAYKRLRRRVARQRN